jgi:hypothetical protein
MRAMLAPGITISGPRSPPMASSAMVRGLLTAGISESDLNRSGALGNFALLVVTAGGADVVWPL